MKIGIIGNGFVGKATTILGCKDIEIIAYDKNPDLCVPKGTKIEDMKECELIFISVPTPMRKEDGKCCLNIVKSVVKELKEKNIVDEPNNFIVIRSTVLPGTSDELDSYFMPEFLTEKNFMEDFRTCQEWVFGLKGNRYDNVFMEKINKLFMLAKENKCIESNSTNFVKNKEAEMIKYFRNCFLALKVSFCNEMYDYCQIKDIDYEKVRDLATKDTRIGTSHSKVPGHDGKRGYGGTCFPKDTKAMMNSMIDNNIEPHIFRAMDYRNEEEQLYNYNFLLL
jgi:UDPglucose 6-dehydrogenase